MEPNILQKQKKSKFQLGDLVRIKKSPYNGIKYTDGIIVSFSETGLAEIICMVNNKNIILAFYDNELENDNINPNSFEAQGFPPY